MWIWNAAQQRFRENMALGKTSTGCYYRFFGLKIYSIVKRSLWNQIALKYFYNDNLHFCSMMILCEYVKNWVL